MVEAGVDKTEVKALEASDLHAEYVVCDAYVIDSRVSSAEQHTSTHSKRRLEVETCR